MSAIKMDELLVSWLGSDDVYENVMELIENYRTLESSSATAVEDEKKDDSAVDGQNATEAAETTRGGGAGVIPPFYPVTVSGRVRRRRQQTVSQKDTWDPLPADSPDNDNNSNNTNPTDAAANSKGGRASNAPPSPPLLPQLDAAVDSGTTTTTTIAPNVDPKTAATHNNNNNNAADGSDNNGNDNNGGDTEPAVCVRDQTMAIFLELGQDSMPNTNENESNLNNNDLQDDPAKKDVLVRQKYLTTESFVRVTKDVCGFPSFFNIPLYARILYLWNATFQQQQQQQQPMEVITFDMMEWFWKTHLEPYDPCDRFFNLVKQVDADAILRDDFLPFIKALLQDHPGLEFLSSHAEFQEKYAVTVITRIFYCVNKCHSGRITARQVRRSDLLSAFQQVDEEEDINKVTRYFSYEHFYVLYCRFWELDHDRDYRITREDLLKYGDQSLSHMIVDRIFDAAPRPFEQQLQQQQQQTSANDNNNTNDRTPSHRDYLSYEDFIYFMLSEEDKSNEVSVRYWFTCVDVDGDGKLNNMEMRSFYAVQLHRMQFMGHEIVPFEDMLCQMMDMIKPASQDWLVETDFLQPECRQVSGALFDALFNLNKYLLFEQRDPFVERQKREDEFDCDWDRFACLDYSRLAMEEEAREEEAMEIDWVTVDDEEEGEDDDDDDEDDDEITQDTDDDSESDLQGAAMLQGAGGGGGLTSSEAPF